MSDSDKQILKLAEKASVRIAFLEAAEAGAAAESRILCEKQEREKLAALLKKEGWRENRAVFRQDKYLYGTEPFLAMEKGNARLVLLCQIACRSTLHGEWVPLDRQINLGALDRLRREDGLPRLSCEDELCYLLAKCVYTEKAFAEPDVSRIAVCLKKADREILMPKLTGVFFRFTERLLQLAEEKKYEEIIPSLWRFAEY